MFFISFSKSSYKFTNILLITLYPVTLIYHSTFLHDCVFIQEVLDGMASFEVYFYPVLTANSLKAFTNPFSVRHYDVNVGFFIVSFVGVVGVISVVFFFKFF